MERRFFSRLPCLPAEIWKNTFCRFPKNPIFLMRHYFSYVSEKKIYQKKLVPQVCPSFHILAKNETELYDFLILHVYIRLETISTVLAQSSAIRRILRAYKMVSLANSSSKFGKSPHFHVHTKWWRWHRFEVDNVYKC